MEENTVNAVQEVVVEPQTNAAESVHEEVATSTVQETTGSDKVQTPEENSQFADIRRKMEAEKAEAVKQAAQEAKNAFIKEQFGFESIDEYKQAQAERKLKEKAQEFVNEGLSEEYAMSLAEAEAIRTENAKLKTEQTKKAELESKIQKENQDFLDYYKESNGSDYAKGTELPQAVWDKVQEGTPLKYAYMEHQLNEMRTGTQQQQTNEQHAQQTAGSVKGVDSTPNRPLTLEDIDSMSPQQLAKPEIWKQVRKLTGMR